jgi:hypothetical protein
VLVRAFHVHDLAGAKKTRKARWHALKELAGFLRDRRDAETARDLNDTLLRRFIAWMADRHDRARGRRAWRDKCHCYALIERAAHEHQRLRRSTFIQPISSRTRQAQKAEKEAVIAGRSDPGACYREIDEAWKIFQYGQTITALPEPPPPIPRGIGKDRLIWLHHRAGGGIAPTVEQMRAHGLSKETLQIYGRQRGFARHFHLVTETLVPFYIVLAIQTAANPDPLRLIRRDCYVPHPLDEERVFIEWPAETGGRIKRMQRRSFGRAGQIGAAPCRMLLGDDGTASAMWRQDGPALSDPAHGDFAGAGPSPSCGVIGWKPWPFISRFIVR